jgi:hypothetical protein
MIFYLSQFSKFGGSTVLYHLAVSAYNIKENHVKDKIKKLLKIQFLLVIKFFKFLKNYRFVENSMKCVFLNKKKYI